MYSILDIYITNMIYHRLIFTCRNRFITGNSRIHLARACNGYIVTATDKSLILQFWPVYHAWSSITFFKLIFYCCTYRISNNHFKDLIALAPKRPDWDLKRAIEPRLERLKKKTERAIAELIRERLKASNDLAAQVAAAGPDTF